MELFCQATPQGLVPLYDSDLEAKHKLQEGKVYKVTVSTPRNYNFHKKFFALVRLTYYNLPETLERKLGIHNEEDLLTALKVELGLCDIYTIDGRTIVKPQSISIHRNRGAAVANSIRIVLTMEPNYENMTKQELIDLIVKRERYHKLLQKAIRHYAQSLLEELNKYKEYETNICRNARQEHGIH